MSRPSAPAAYDAARIRFELGEAVRRRREELGLTQAQLAERAGLKQPAVARFEAGGTMPTIPMLERLAAALGLRLTVQLQPSTKAS
jgi:HTH-type transcriptional regulator/antitoxin HipB